MLTSQKFQKILLKWFDLYGRKELPWQQNKTAYRVWVSEVMLQQTQVNTVIPYYLRFMQHFPTIKSLANAHEDEVLHLWAGLGYYSRARNLHRAAKIIMTKFKGKFPTSFSDVINLPGIGASTAGAILSIAFDQPVPILDGNVKRVLARCFGMHEPINDKTGVNQLWMHASMLMPKKRCADYTQAIMDLGATLCLRQNPDCMHCPFQKYCVAYARNETHLLPIKKVARKIPTKEKTFLIFKNNNAIFLEKRPTKGIWGGLWSVPELPGKPKKKSIQHFCKTQFSVEIKNFETLKPFRHTFTHYHLNIFPIVISLPTPTLVARDQLWYTSASLKIGLPKPIQSLLRQLI